MFKRLITRAASVSTRATVIGALLILVAVSAVAWFTIQVNLKSQRRGSIFLNKMVYRKTTGGTFTIRS